MIINLSGYTPLPSQKKFHDSKAKYRCFFGGFGSGKTFALCYELLMLALEEPGGRIMICRKTYPELEATTKFEFMQICPPELIKNFRDTKNDLELTNGTMIFFRALDNIHKSKSANLSAIGVDEASEIGEDMFSMLVSRLRFPGVKRRCLVMSTNPEGHNWIWRKFVNKEINKIDETDMGVKDQASLYDYVTSETTENTYLPDDYVDTLRSTFSEAWIRRYVNCSFDEFSGLIFYGFEPSRNLTDDNKIDPEHDRQIIAIDPGIDTSAVLFGNYKYEKKRLKFYDEIYRNRVGLPELASLIKARNAYWKVTRPIYLIDPSSKREEQTSRSTIVKDLLNLGIPCKLANNDVNMGIIRLNSMFKSGQATVSKYLKNYVSEISEYYIDEKTGKPKAGQKDHLLDNGRYIVNFLSASEVDMTMTKEEEMAQLHKRREGLLLYKRGRGTKNIRKYLTNTGR